MCSVQCAVCSVQCAVCSTQCTVCSVQYTVHSVQCAVCSAQCTVCSVQYTVCSEDYQDAIYPLCAALKWNQVTDKVYWSAKLCAVAFAKALQIFGYKSALVTRHLTHINAN